MANGCADYFESLYRKNENIDPSHVQNIEKLVAEYSDTCKEAKLDPILGTTFSSLEVNSGVKKLKLGKAAGADGITAEHVKYGGDSVVGIITAIFNKMISLQYWPQSFSNIIEVLVYKGNEKDPLSLDKGYRGISLLNIISKLFDILVYERIKVWSENKNIPNGLQGAGREKVSCLHTSFMMQETIAYTKESMQKVYCAFLDTKKAFDSIWTDALLVKLWDIGIRGTTWALTKQSYLGRKVHVTL